MFHILPPYTYPLCVLLTLNVFTFWARRTEGRATFMLHIYSAFWHPILCVLASCKYPQCIQVHLVQQAKSKGEQLPYCIEILVSRTLCFIMWHPMCCFSAFFAHPVYLPFWASRIEWRAIYGAHVFYILASCILYSGILYIPSVCASHALYFHLFEQAELKGERLADIDTLAPICHLLSYVCVWRSSWVYDSSHIWSKIWGQGHTCANLTYVPIYMCVA